MATIFEWFEELGEPLEYRSLIVLDEQETWILDAHEGLPPMRLTLASYQFSELQACWQANNLPHDLYYPAEAAVSNIETTTESGGLVRVERKYGPVEWAHLSGPSNQVGEVPSEEDRIRSFVQACEDFARATMLRRFELTEPGREVDTKELRRIDQLRADVLAAAARAREGRSAPDASNNA